MTTLSSLLKERIAGHLEKTIGKGLFDKELPDYVILLLTNGKNKKEIINELSEFIAEITATKLVEWVFNEIDIIKKEKLKESSEKKKRKEEEKRLKRERQEKLKRDQLKEKRTAPPFALSSDEELLKPPPLIRGRRERIRSDEKPSRHRRSDTSSSSSSSSSRSSSPRSRRHKRKKRRSRSRSSTRSRSRSRSPARIKKRVVQKTQEAFAEVAITRTIKRKPDYKNDRIELSEEKSPPRIRRRKSIERIEKLKTTPAHMLVMPETNPFSEKEESSDENDWAPKSPPSTKSSSSENSKLRGLENSMKERIAAKLTKSKETVTNSNNAPNERDSAASNNVDLIKQFERKINNNSDEFGPALPPKVIKNNFSENVDLRRSVIINQRQKNKEDSSPVPTDGEDEEEEESIQVSSETSKREVVSSSSSKKEKLEQVKTAKKESESSNELPNKKSLLEKTEKSSAEKVTSVMADFRKSNENGWTKMHTLAGTGKLYKIRSFLKSEDLALIDKSGTSVLHEATGKGFLWQVSNMLDAKLMLLSDKKGVTPFHLATERKELYILSSLDFSELNVDTADKQGRTALHIAAQGNYLEGAKKLLAEGASTELKDNKGLLPQEHATDAELVKLLGGTPLPADKKVIRINPKMINMVPPNMLQQVGAAHSHSAVHQHQPMIQTLAPSHSGLPVRAHLPHSAHHHSAPAAAFQKTRFRNPRMINSTHSSARKLSSETPSNSTAEVKLTKTQNSKDQTSDEAQVKKKDEGLKLQLPQDKTYLDTINDGKSDSDDSENDDSCRRYKGGRSW